MHNTAFQNAAGVCQICGAKLPPRNATFCSNHCRSVARCGFTNRQLVMVNRLCSENEKRRPGCPQYKEVARTVGMPWESVRHYYRSRASKKVRQEAIVRKKV